MLIQTWLVTLLNAAMVIVASGYVYRISKELRLDVVVISAGLFIVSPIIVLTAGVQGFVFAADLMGPYLFYRYLFSLKSAERGGNLQTLLFLAIFFVPLIATSLALLAGTYKQSLFDIAFELQFFYRSALLLAIFAFFFNAKISRLAFLELTELFIILALVLGLLGSLQYLGFWDINVFDRYSPIEDYLLEYYQIINAGTGFAGLFRGAVGQIFFIMSILSLNYLFTRESKPAFRLLGGLLFGIALFLVIKSFSRAGFYGVIVGVLVYVLLDAKRVGLWIIAAAAASAVALIALGDAVYSDRFIYYNEGDIEGFSSGRLDAWENTFEIFYNEPFIILFGVGAGNERGVADLIGLWGAHNEYLELIFKGGIFMLAIYVAFFSSLFVLFWTKHRQVRYDNVTKVFFSIFIPNCIIAFTQSHLIHGHATYTTIAIIYMLYGVLVSLANQESALSAIDFQPKNSAR